MESEKKNIYITTTLPYVNAKPHVGHALEFVQADILARYNRLIGNEVFFSTGTDEHGIKIYQKAQEEGKDPQTYVDEYAEKFNILKEGLDLSFDNFIRTTDENHKKAAQAFWELCEKNGDIYKKKYTGLYCVGCELFVTEKELVNGECPHHPGTKPQEIEEENYFFKFSAYQEKLLKLYTDNPDFVVPNSRFNEIKAFVERGLEDFSISRLKEKMPWGVSVPGDDEHVMYVWFDALVNYVSTLGWPNNKEKFEKFWPVIQFAGKDNLRQQTAMWQAMLMSAGIEPSKQIFIHGFITSDGQKMSKTVGNVIDPFDLINEYGTDAVRYYFARHVHPFEDSDLTVERFKEAYNANLVNGLGNLTSRILQMSGQYLDEPVDISEIKEMPEIGAFVDKYEFNRAMDSLWSCVSDLDGLIDEQKPFKVVKEDKKKAQLQLTHLIKELSRIAEHLKPFMPETAEKILKAIKENKKPENLFPRKD